MKPHENRIEEEKDMASSPETAPVADSAGNDGTTPLAVYFEVDPALYASVRLKRLPFNRRASGCLKRTVSFGGGYSQNPKRGKRIGPEYQGRYTDVS